MKSIKKIIMVLLGVGMIIINSQTVDAATGNEGYAAYRDGVFFGYDWHAGLWDEPDSSYNLPILHAPGPNSEVGWASWDDFLDGNNFKGTFKPNEFASSSMRDAFVSMGRNLRTENIPYNLGYQVYYDADEVGSYVSYDEIHSIRCDGVIEYIYEWYSYRVYGEDDWWDVTENNVNSLGYHGLTFITPKKQVNYLTEA